MRRQPIAHVVEPVLFAIGCAAADCPEVTQVVGLEHAERLRRIWTCRKHYAGPFARPDDRTRP